ncbi:hypothetical protein SAMN05444722_3662 [Rhodovulum sp. ES.010]|uniref:DUF6524 family protein n=1 Tax=Rhodovulum sp. ES.010 TaxID=1882821 RepID=UPI000926F493|nr:DUF6524 family protein [Rhodovulum sp. ES.010]SIO56908.1 hypothetical protein SAMN05444722_3662 [Rhodovulum sp. ES.010]
MSGFLLRWVIAFLALAALYNPIEGYNYVDWAQANYADQRPLVIGIGVMLGLVLLVLLAGTLRTMGLVGLILFLVIIGLLSYILEGEGIITYAVNDTNTWAGLAVLSLVMAGALSWRSSTRASSRAAKEATKAKSGKPAKA